MVNVSSLLLCPLFYALYNGHYILLSVSHISKITRIVSVPCNDNNK